MVFLFDFSRVILFPKDPNYSDSLNALYKDHKDEENFDFFKYFRLNDELVIYLNSIKDTNDLYMFTSDIIQDAPELQPTVDSLFKKVFSASKMGTNKALPEAYTMIVKDLGVDVKELVYIDDSLVNIEAAKNAGLQTIQYTNNEKLLSKLTEYVQKH